MGISIQDPSEPVVFAATWDRVDQLLSDAAQHWPVKCDQAQCERTLKALVATYQTNMRADAASPTVKSAGKLRNDLWDAAGSMIRIIDNRDFRNSRLAATATDNRSEDAGNQDRRIASNTRQRDLDDLCDQLKPMLLRLKGLLPPEGHFSQGKGGHLGAAVNERGSAGKNLGRDIARLWDGLPEKPSCATITALMRIVHELATGDTAPSFKSIGENAAAEYRLLRSNP